MTKSHNTVLPERNLPTDEGARAEIAMGGLKPVPSPTKQSRRLLTLTPSTWKPELQRCGIAGGSTSCFPGVLDQCTVTHAKPDGGPLVYPDNPTLKAKPRQRDGLRISSCPSPVSSKSAPHRFVHFLRRRARARPRRHCCPTPSCSPAARRLLLSSAHPLGARCGWSSSCSPRPRSKAQGSSKDCLAGLLSRP